MNKSPKIGIPNVSSAIFEHYVAAVKSVGAIPIELTAVNSEEEIRKQIAQCDGVILMGGPDIPPTAYNEPLRPEVRRKLSPEIWNYYGTFARIVLNETPLPVLGTCLGCQNMNVICGGTLYQDIYSQCPNSLWHSRPQENKKQETMHPVSFPEGSPLRDILGSVTMTVNSSHHQAVKNVAPGWKIAAVAPDGIVEAIAPQNPNGRFILGVQWHPERLFDKVAGHAKLFQALIDACQCQELQISSPNYTLIQGGTLCDGTGAPLTQRDVLIQDERIIDILPPGDTSKIDANFVDARGLLVAPGFIDAHAHSEARKLLYPNNLTKLLQGVTTEVNGNCGISPSFFPQKYGNYVWKDFSEYLAILKQSGQSTNSISFMGHNSLRQAVMGDANRQPTSEELQTMRQMLEDALSMGAAGFSSGLTYLPGTYANTDELIALASCLGQKVYATHVRSEGDALLEAAQEAVEIARHAGCPLQFSHIKTMFARNHHKAAPLVELLEKARSEGVQITADRYPYLYSCTLLRQILPAPFDKIADIAAYIQESQEHFKEIAESLKHSPRDLPTTILIASQYKGLTLKQASEQSGKAIEVLATEIMRDIPTCYAAYLAMSPDNLNRFLSLPWICAGSDNVSMQLDNPADFAHPRAAGTFPLFFQQVSKRLGIPEAIRKMTSLPAAIFQIPERGIIRPGYFADIVLIQPESFDSQADYAGNNQTPTGVQKVYVAGHETYDAKHPERIGTFGRYIAI